MFAIMYRLQYIHKQISSLQYMGTVAKAMDLLIVNVSQPYIINHYSAVARTE